MKKIRKRVSTSAARGARAGSGAKALGSRQTGVAACPLCSGALRSVRERRTVAIGRRRVSIDDQFHRCDRCGNILYAPGEADASLRRAAEVVRREDDLLAPDEIRAIREALRLTQAQFEALLGTGPKTAVRWERGTVAQNITTDRLLRLIRADVANARRLAEWHRVSFAVAGVTADDRSVASPRRKGRRATG